MVDVGDFLQSLSGFHLAFCCTRLQCYQDRRLRFNRHNVIIHSVKFEEYRSRNKAGDIIPLS